MIFRTVYHTPNALDVLYQLLAERTPEQSISHVAMPTHAEHRRFVMSAPYASWMLIEDDGLYRRLETHPSAFVGSVYVSKANEIGIAIFKRYQRKGYGRAALEWARDTFRDRQLFANVNPDNEASIAFFERHGGVHIQNTFRL